MRLTVHPRQVQRVIEGISRLKGPFILGAGLLAGVFSFFASPRSALARSFEAQLARADPRGAGVGASVKRDLLPICKRFSDMGLVKDRVQGKLEVIRERISGKPQGYQTLVKRPTHAAGIPRPVKH